MLSLATPAAGTAAVGADPESSLEAENVVREQMGVGLPLRFEANSGQASPDVLFIARGPIMLQVTVDGLRVRGPDGPLLITVPGGDWSGAQGTGAMTAKVNYFLGDLAVTDVPQYERVTVPGLLPGIDLVLYAAADGSLEFDLVVAPNADPTLFRMETTGSWRLESEELRLEPLGLALQAPVAYQDLPSGRVGVDARYSLQGDAAVISLGTYDSNQVLTIDPKLGYGTYLRGGSAGSQGAYQTHESINALAGSPTEGVRIIYAVGTTSSPDFDQTGAVYDPTQSGYGNNDVFVAKFDVDQIGQASLLWVTFLGGSGADRGTDIAVDGTRVIIVGETTSPSFPTVRAYKSTPGGQEDAFLSALNKDGNSLTYSTYLGGAATDAANAVATDGNGIAAVVGFTEFAAAGMATANAFQSKHGDDPNTSNGELPMSDAFVAKIDVGLQGAASLKWNTFFGGGGPDEAIGVDMDPQGKVYFVGATHRSCTDGVRVYTKSTCATSGPAFPVSVGAMTPSNGFHDLDGFVAMLPSDGGAGLSAPPFSTLLAGTNPVGCCEYWYQAEAAMGVDESKGDVFVVGSSYSRNFPVTSGSYLDNDKGQWDQDIFVLRMDPLAVGASQVEVGTWWDIDDSTSQDLNVARDILVDSQDRVVVAGITGVQGGGGVPTVNLPAGVEGLQGPDWQTDMVLGRFNRDLTELQLSFRWGTNLEDGTHYYWYDYHYYMWYYGAETYGALEGRPHPIGLTAIDEIAIGTFTWADSLPTPNGLPSTNGDYHSDPYMAVFTKAEPIPMCKATGPFWRGYPITFSTASSKALDAPIDQTTWEFWFDYPMGYPNNPDLALGDPGYSANPTWTYPPGYTPGEKLVHMRVKDKSGVAPDTGEGECKLKLINRPPIAALAAEEVTPWIDSTSKVIALAFDADGNPTLSRDVDEIDSTSGLSFYWSLPGNVDCTENPSADWEITCNWTELGSFPFAVVVVDADGGASFALQTIIVRLPRPTAVFTGPAEPIRYCYEPPFMEFDEDSTKALSDIGEWDWDFDGDGVSDLDQEGVVTWTFPDSGDHPVTLTVTDLQGYQHSVTHTFVTEKVTPPLADFGTAIPDTIYLGAATHFEDHSIPGPGGALFNRKWDLGDGTIRTENSFSHTYTAPGDYTVTLGFEDGTGCIAKAEKRLRVVDLTLGLVPETIVVDRPGPTVDFEFIPDLPAVDAPVLLRDITATAGSPIATRTWDFGDGTPESAEAIVSHRFAQEGTYDVTLTVLDSAGRGGSITKPIGVVGPGADAAFERDAPLPVADAGSDQSAFPGMEVVLDGSSSLSPSGHDLGFQWEQLQGPPVSLAASRSARPSFVAPELPAGASQEAIVFRLTVADGARRSIPDLVTLRVVPETPADFEATPGTGGLVQFVPEGVPEDLPVRWTFGDGATSTETTPSHVFPASGTYEVSLEVGQGSDAQVVRKSFDVDSRTGLKARQAQEAPEGNLRFAGLPVMTAFGAFVVAAALMGVGLWVMTRRAGNR